MTNAELLTKIREEVERKYISTSDSRDRWNYGYDTACEEILSFLDTLEEESSADKKAVKEISKFTAKEITRQVKAKFDLDKLREVAKPAEWSEEDERMLERAIHIIVEYSDIDEKESGVVQNWLNDLPERFTLSSKQELSEEDELMRTVVIQTLKMFGGRGTTEMQIDWLKSLRPQKKEDLPKWLVDEDYDEKIDGKDFSLHPVGIAYRGYYIPYSDLLKLPKEDEK